MTTRTLRRVTLVAVALCVLAACAPRRRELAQPAGIITVPTIVQWALAGTNPSDIYGEIERSGTVYRLTPAQSTSMSEAGVPNALLSRLQLVYENALAKNPSLATDDSKWRKIGDYWYGGTPVGWPRDWVMGAPPIGEALRQMK
ncbi:MAG: hypothetical protein KIT14_01375 [bacterium]|nr:hypothetical protein [bacterium]